MKMILIAITTSVLISGCHQCRPRLGENIRSLNCAANLIEQTPDYDKYSVYGVDNDDTLFITTDKNGVILSTWKRN